MLRWRRHIGTATESPAERHLRFAVWKFVDVSSTPLLTPTTSVTDAFHALAAPAVGEALRRAHSLRLDANAETFHKFRIALRRLRSLWWAYGPLLNEIDAASRRHDFKALATAAGKTRDWDVLRELLTRDESTRTSFRPLLPSIDAHRANALAYSCSVIANADLEQLLHQALESAVEQLPATRAGPMLGDFAWARIAVAERKLGKRVRRVIHTGCDDYADLHQVRIAGKKLRYLLEFFAPALAASHHSAIRGLTAVQDELGDLNDLVASAGLIRQHPFPLEQEARVMDLVQWLQQAQQRRRDRALSQLRAMPAPTRDRAGLLPPPNAEQ